MPKSISATVTGSTCGTQANKDPKLIGNVNEATVHINDIQPRTLIDTGSCVSVISKTFHDNNLPKADIKPLNGILNIECADGNNLPYLGFIEASITSVEGIPRSKPTSCIFLVTPDTAYNANTPVIAGTNILQELIQDCKNNHGERYLQVPHIHTPCYLAFTAITV